MTIALPTVNEPSGSAIGVELATAAAADRYQRQQDNPQRRHPSAPYEAARVRNAVLIVAECVDVTSSQVFALAGRNRAGIGPRRLSSNC